RIKLILVWLYLRQNSFWNFLFATRGCRKGSKRPLVGIPKSAWRCCGGLGANFVHRSSDRPRLDQTVRDFAVPAASNLPALGGAWRYRDLRLWHQCRGNLRNLVKIQSGLGLRLANERKRPPSSRRP